MSIVIYSVYSCLPVYLQMFKDPGAPAVWDWSNDLSSADTASGKHVNGMF